MLASERHIAMVQVIPLGRMLTETDGPFTQTEKHPSRPVDVAHAVEALGRLYNLPSVNIARIIRNNLHLLLD